MSLRLKDPRTAAFMPLELPHVCLNFVYLLHCSSVIYVMPFIVTMLLCFFLFSF